MTLEASYFQINRGRIAKQCVPLSFLVGKDKSLVKLLKAVLLICMTSSNWLYERLPIFQTGHSYIRAAETSAEEYEYADGILPLYLGDIENTPLNIQYNTVLYNRTLVRIGIYMD